MGVWTANDLIVDLAAASEANPGVIDAPLPADLLGLIERGAGGLADAARVVEAAVAKPQAQRAANGVYALKDVALHAPHVPGARIGCAGGNFADHTAGDGGAQRQATARR